MKYRATQDLKSNVELRFLSQSGRGVPGPALILFFRSLEENIEMLKATAGKILPTTITGSLPRPSWYTENLGTRSFLEAMVYTRFREQYTDTIAVYMKEQAIAGLDIVTDGDCRFNQDIGGQSWTSYPPNHMSGFDTGNPLLARTGAGGHRIPARSYSSRLPRSASHAEDYWTCGSGEPSIYGAMEGSSADDVQAREVWYGHA